MNTEGWQCWEFLGYSLVAGEHNPLFNPSDMTGKGQPHCLDPKSSCLGKGDTLVPQAKHLALHCPGTTTTQSGFGLTLDPLASPGLGMISQLSPLQPPPSAGPPHRGHGHQALCAPEGPGGEQGLEFPFTCTGGERALKRGARQHTEVWGRERGGLAHLQASCASISLLGKTPDRPQSQERGTPPRLKAMGPPLAQGQR